MTSKKVDIEIHEYLIEWLDLQIKAGMFTSRSQGIECTIENFCKKYVENNY